MMASSGRANSRAGMIEVPIPRLTNSWLPFREYQPRT